MKNMGKDLGWRHLFTYDDTQTTRNGNSVDTIRYRKAAYRRWSYWADKSTHSVSKVWYRSQADSLRASDADLAQAIAQDEAQAAEQATAMAATDAMSDVDDSGNGSSAPARPTRL